VGRERTASGFRHTPASTQRWPSARSTGGQIPAPPTLDERIEWLMGEVKRIRAMLIPLKTSRVELQTRMEETQNSVDELTRRLEKASRARKAKR
jgi:hypothetical protein